MKLYKNIHNISYQFLYANVLAKSILNYTEYIFSITYGSWILLTLIILYIFMLVWPTLGRPL
jgi:hypothetical protein